MVHLQIDRASRVATVTLSRPEKRNALSPELVTRLTDVFKSLDNDDSCTAVVLTGTGNTFSAGADLEALRKMQSASFEENVNDSRALADMYISIRKCPKPVIARVNGHAIAGGMGLLLSCDYAIVSPKAKFGFPETRIGMVPAIVAVLLRERVGALVQRNVLLGGKLFDANTALSYGLINSIAGDQSLNDAVEKLARELVANTSSHAVAETKNLLRSIANMSFDDAIEYSVRANAKARESDDCHAGIAAFLAKKDPPWKLRS